MHAVAVRALRHHARPAARRLATQPCANTRVIAVVAHVDAGKTTLTEEILNKAGVLRNSGRVDAGSATTDFLVQERERGITIQSAAAHFDWNNTNIVLVDTPGHVDFGFEVDRTLRAPSTASCLVVDAVAGAQARTEAVARAARETFDLPMIAVVNKMDRMGADFEAATKSLSVRCDLTPIKVQAPLVEKDVFEGPRDLIGARQSVGGGRGRLDDAFAELYIEDTFTAEDLTDAVARLTKSKDITPVLCAAALKGLGVEKVLDAVAAFLPSPRDVLEEEADFAALIFKVSHDPRRGPLCFARCYGGSLSPKTMVECGVSIITARGPFEC